MHSNGSICSVDHLLLSCLFLYPHLNLPSSTLTFFFSHYPHLLLTALPLSLQLDLARKMEEVAAEKGVKLYLATDVVVADKFAADAAVQVMMISRYNFLLFHVS